MEIGSILFVLAIVLLAGAYLARPLAEPANPGVAPAHPQFSRLQARRERLLDAIRELDSDHAMGKVLTAEYQQHRRQLALQGAAVLRQIDELTGASPANPLEAELEARVAELKQQLSGRQPVGGEPRERRARWEGQEQPAGREPPASRGHPGDRGQQERAAAYCPACSTPAVAGDRFCSNCGTALQEPGA